ncbi:DUF3558 family protein [Nocardia amamiensis]|uniref:DUF3558 family protein n=1 Tax=Nocardia amamiensis TaxID=404578 RepID=UPI00082E8BA7|nr:DUF3558 family protein [Nocardia amamiensis]
MLIGLRSRRPVGRLSLGLAGLLVVVGAVAACDTNDTSSGSEATSTSQSTTRTAAVQTFAELAARPCTAFDAADTERFQVTIAGYEIPGPPNGCFWMTKDFGIGFHPHPSSDRTSLVPPKAGATQTTVDGRRAVRIPESRSDGKNGGCKTEVAVDSATSLSVEITVQAGVYGGTTLDTCAIGSDVATAILAHLR